MAVPAADSQTTTAAVRAAVGEARWVTRHVVRSIDTTVASGRLARAPVLPGRPAADAAGHGATRSARAAPGPTSGANP